MKYSDQILENKTFKVVKEILYNITLAICIMLMGVLVLVYGFKYQLFNVMSDSQAPIFRENDMVIVKEQDKYVKGDILQFDYNGTPTAHRLILVYPSGGITYYICHGDNVQSTRYKKESNEWLSKWEDESAYIEGLLESGQETIQSLKDNRIDYGVLQIVTESKINGKVVKHIDNLGIVVKYIQEHYILLATLIGAIWCISYVVQNESETKRSLRLF